MDIKTKDRLDPKGQSLALKYWSYIKFPIIKNFPPPNKSGVIKFPILNTKTKTNPAATPGRVNGSIILKKVENDLAPRSFEASIRLLSNFDTELKIVKTTNGR
jgi:hypothetical protein